MDFVQKKKEVRILDCFYVLFMVANVWRISPNVFLTSTDGTNLTTLLSDAVIQHSPYFLFDLLMIVGWNPLSRYSHCCSCGKNIGICNVGLTWNRPKTSLCVLMSDGLLEGTLGI